MLLLMDQAAVRAVTTQAALEGKLGKKYLQSGYQRIFRYQGEGWEEKQSYISVRDTGLTPWNRKGFIECWAK